jgi:cyclic pyranopterin phosphate synthase
MNMNGLVDPHNRRVNYLRISITDRCNLRCRYCMPKEGISQFGHSEILSYEEILRVAGLAVKRGIDKVRITGGEPLVRKGVVNLVEKLSGLSGVKDLSMTTNAVLLREFARDLRRAGLNRINISMDSLDPGKYREITRGGDLTLVWEGIEAARREGIHPIKINVVAIAGFNDGEIEDFARLTLQEPFQVRFIEFMPIGAGSEWTPQHCISCQEVRKRIERIFPLVPLAEGENGHGGPARLFKFPGAAGEIGFISPLSEHFCGSCNRLRLTADGKLKTCLFSGELIDLKSLLRSGAGEAELEKKLDEALLTKPLHHGPMDGVMKRCHLPMVKIGG